MSKIIQGCSQDDHLQMGLVHQIVSETKVGDKGNHSNVVLEENLRQSIKELCKRNEL